MYRMVELPFADWSPRVANEESRRLAGNSELGKVRYPPLALLYFPEHSQWKVLERLAGRPLA